MWSKRACADIHKHQDESVEGEDGCICSLEVVFFFWEGGEEVWFFYISKAFPYTRSPPATSHGVSICLCSQ